MRHLASLLLALALTLSFARAEEAEAPVRFVALYGSFAECVLLAGGELVGATRDAVEERGIADVAVVGTVKQPSLELVLALEPDFVLLSANIASQVGMIEALDAAGIRYAACEVDSYTQYMDLMRDLCTLTGRDDLYARQEALVEKPIEALLAEKSGEKGTCLLLRAYGGGARAKGSDGMAGAMLCDMGFANVADSDETLLDNLSLEAILAADPEWVFVTTMGGADGEAYLQSLRDDPAWSGLTALREGRAFALPDDLFHFKPNERWAEAYRYLADLCAP